MLKILFMGTPDFATACLKELVEKGENVVGVVTQPDKAKDRGMKTGFSDVKKYALSAGLDVYQPQTLKDGAIKELLNSLCPDVIAVVAYGKILPEYVLNYPKYGCVNVHGSLLPKYRGAAPIQRAVMNGEKVTGVTTMLMDKGLDTGDMLLCEPLEIGENSSAGEVFNELSKIGARLLLKTLHGLEKGEITPSAQDNSHSTYAEKIESGECSVDFNAEAISVHNKIRGLYPFPGAFCISSGKILKLCESRVYDKEFDAAKVGEVCELSKNGIAVKCGKGTVLLTRLKPEGKSEMSASDLINGRKIALGDILGGNKL